MREGSFMIIYKVRSGEDLVDVASKFGTGLKRITADNGMLFTVSPTEGQNLIITKPISTYTASGGDTADTIASVFGIDREKLLQRNPELLSGVEIKNGDEIVIESGEAELGKIKVMASLKPSTDSSAARKIMPYLTYLSIRCCGLRSDGSLYMQSDRELFALAGEHRVVPVLEIQKIDPHSESWWEVIGSVEGICRCAQNIKQAALSNGYGGINFNLGEIPLEAFDGYVELVSTVKAMVSPWDMPVISTVPETTVISSDVELLGDSVDEIALFPKSPGGDIIDVLEIEDLARLLIEVSGPDKISLCVPMSATDVALDRNGKGVREEKFSTAQATRLAMERRAAITYDETRCLSEYEYLDMEFGSLVTHKVEFQDLEGLHEILCMAKELGIDSLNVFNADKYYAPFWTMLASLCDIEKKY